MAIVLAEPGRKKAYETDLRWRIVYQRIGMNLSYKRISSNLNIAPSTVHQSFKQFTESGCVASCTDVRGKR